jgi:amidase
MDGELWAMGATELAASIGSGEVTSREVVAAHLDRIAKVNGGVNAVTAVLEKPALQAADEADERVRRGEATGPLHGVPFTVKENIDLAGTASTWGLAPLSEAVVPVDAPVVERLRTAGAIPIARTNLPDLALRWHTDSGAHGATVNPWDRARTPGGSSGGEAVALATGMTPLGLGNDLGGSLRVPAHACGVASLKPTFGRVPQACVLEPMRDVFGSPPGMWATGPMARHVRDLRVAFHALAGSDARDPMSVPAPLDGPAVPTPIRVAVVTSPGGAPVHPDAAASIRAAADALADAGYAVEELDPPRLADAVQQWVLFILSDMRVLAPMLGPLASEGANRFLEAALATTPPADTAGLVIGHMGRHALAREWSEFQATHPLVLGPVSTQPPFEVDYDLEGPDAVTDLVTRLTLTVAANVLGLPAAAVPTGMTGGLPQGVQILGPRFREDLCLDAAEAVEERLGTLTPIDPR